MQLQTSHNRWSCLLTATAMVLDTDQDQLMSIVGHDGSMILWPEQPEPLCRKAFHIEEMQWAAAKLGAILATFTREFTYAPNGFGYRHTYTFNDEFARVTKLLNGILVGSYDGKHAHAVAWNAAEGLIYDPSGRRTPPDGFLAEAFHACIPAGV